MNDQEFTDAVAKLEAADTELASLQEQATQAIASARIHNQARKVIEAKRDEIRASVAPLRVTVEAAMQERKRIANEKAAEAAKAAQPQEPSQIDILTQQVAKLTELLAAKQ